MERGQHAHLLTLCTSFFCRRCIMWGGYLPYN